jgi:L-threonylcarbamoyladenylate synthase
MEIVDLETAAELLKRGEIVAFPTETVYGLGAALFNELALQKVFAAKQRPSDNPLIVHIADHNQLECVASEISRGAQSLIEAFFPGPLTLVLPKAALVPSLATAGLDTVAVRMPAHAIARKLIRLVEEPLAAPSANLSGKPSSTLPEHVMEDLTGSIAALIDGGECPLGIESTIVKVSPQPLILRPGAIPREEIEAVLRQKVAYYRGTETTPLAPGLKYKHYASKAAIKLFTSRQKLDDFLSTAPDVKRSVLLELTPKELYSQLRSADANFCEEILILCNERIERDVALMNRLSKAATQIH